MAGGFVRRTKRRLQGIALLAVVALFVAFCIGIYNKALPWQHSDKVTLEVARIGDELIVPADVKLRGVLVGRVSGAATNGDGARLTLQIDPSQMANIPADVQAYIIPKTLFGEKYVNLVAPPPTAHQKTFATLAADHTPIVISQAHSKTAIELQTVFTSLVPVLRTLNPAALSMTLNAVATALDGRGNELGQNLVLIDDYLKQINPDLPTMLHDIRALTKTATYYNQAAPDLLGFLSNTSFTSHTFSTRASQYAHLLATSNGLATESTKVLDTNAHNLVDLAATSTPIANLLSTYSDNLECLPNGLAIYDRTRLEAVFDQGPYLHITLTPVGDRGTYKTDDDGVDDTPSTADYATEPPDCYGLPYGTHGLDPQAVRYPGKVQDHYDQGGLLTGSPGALLSVLEGLLTNGSSGTGGAGSPLESSQIQQLIKTNTAETDAAASPGLSDLLVGPMLRGMTVKPS